ncbi:FGGY-family carbohydrate kinase [Cumulibacter manganitolerans]|uniref:FGGY-family carbohydrate kinase n=1 Tax=Cumulibacter manganitolerans TaxID=1884992 RepID=UPI00225E2743|nr:FGGY-family carbohydrate kinase [Cumulibacter manganitolerans]
MQFQADILDVSVIRPHVTETTALGAAYAPAWRSGSGRARTRSAPTAPRTVAGARRSIRRCARSCCAAGTRRSRSPSTGSTTASSSRAGTHPGDHHPSTIVERGRGTAPTSSRRTGRYRRWCHRARWVTRSSHPPPG